MRQELLAGLIVVTFGVPVAIIANGKELVRELGAIELAVRGNPAPLKQMLAGPQTNALPAPQVDEIDAILRAGARAMAESQIARRPAHHTVESQVMIPEPPRMSQDDMFVLAGTELQLASRELRDISTVVIAVPMPQVSANAEWPAMDAPRAAKLAAAVVDEFSLAANAAPAPVTRIPHARGHVAATAFGAADGPWMRQTLAGASEDAITAEASTDGDGVDVAAASDTSSTDGNADRFQQIGAIDGGFTAAVPVTTSIGGLTDVTAATR